ncbi:MAG TPA: FAD-dependent oxidoreductase [Kiritimatiellia bacterium]|nr:FAD-dependent oxidoreductase [Kiritimatiellia bacterium]HPS05944.1 FAD-dependent oxidoreductase [Kiritimatiellia bacterium]
MSLNQTYLGTGIALFAGVLQAATMLVETEAFADKGGWVVDQQFMDQMGSPFLMAHGVGTPVADASTSLDVPEAGRYRVLARTRNWAALWSQKDAPGKFQVLVNGVPLAKVLGAEGAEWAWYEAGDVTLEKGDVKLGLHDLTGFNGRCDALILTTDPAFKPENEVAKLETFRRKMGAVKAAHATESVDLIIAGGGIPGVCMAISAARLGLTVALIQDRPVLGGNNSSEVRVHLAGRMNLGLYPKLGDVVSEIGPRRGGNAQPGDYYEDARKIEAVKAEKNVRLFLNTRALGVEKEGSKITAVVGRNIETGQETRFVAPLVADCTGDGVIGMLASAEYRYGRESKDETGESTAADKADSQTMGSSVQWYSREAQAPVSFPDIVWGIAFNDKNCERVKMGEWTWETGMNYHQISEFERVRDYGLLVVFSNWSFLKNRSAHKAEYAKSRLEWVAYVAGKRESRRLMGDLVLKEQDLVDKVIYPDATACTTWTIDLHYPDPKNTKNFPGAEFKSIAKHKAIYPYPIPYRCLYSKNIENLFMAGRNISVTHVALGTVRVMRTGGMLGEVIGMAASLCKKHNCSPRDVYTAHLDELKGLMSQGVGLGKDQPPQKYNLGGTLLKEKKE